MITHLVIGVPHIDTGLSTISCENTVLCVVIHNMCISLAYVMLNVSDIVLYVAICKRPKPRIGICRALEPPMNALTAYLFLGSRHDLLVLHS